MGTISYRIIRFAVASRGEVIKLQQKLPINLSVCDGYLTNVNSTHLLADKTEVGLIAISFNSKKEHAVNDVVGFELAAESKPEFQMLFTELNKGEIVHVVYADKYPSELQFQPYWVSLYLRCQTEAKCLAHV